MVNSVGYVEIVKVLLTAGANHEKARFCLLLLTFAYFLLTSAHL